MLALALPLLAVLLLLLSPLFPSALADSNPIQAPNPNGYDAQKAAAAAGTDENAYAETYSATYDFLPLTFDSSLAKFVLVDISIALPTVFGSTYKLVANHVWVNHSAQVCSSSTALCPGVYQLNGHNFGTFRNAPQVYSEGGIDDAQNLCERSFYINWTGGASFSTEGGEWTFTCMETFTVVQAQSWAAQGPTDTLLTNVSFFGTSFYGGATPTTASIRDTAWWVPYPAGSWITSDTVVEDITTGAVIPSTNYAYLSSAFLLEWTNYPIASTTQTSEFSYSLTTTSGGSGGGGGGGTGGGTNTTGQNGNTTTTGGTNSTFGSGFFPVAEVVLGMENVTPGPTYYQASVSWENIWNYNFTGMFYLTGSWIATASSVALFANGVPVPAYQFLVSNTSIVVFSGYLTLVSQGTVSFVAHYTPTSSFNFLGTLFVLDGIPVTVWVLLAWGGAGACVAVGFFHARDGPPTQGSTGGRVLSVLVFTLALIAIFTLRG